MLGTGPLSTEAISDGGLLAGYNLFVQAGKNIVTRIDYRLQEIRQIPAVLNKNRKMPPSLEKNRQSDFPLTNLIIVE